MTRAESIPIDDDAVASFLAGNRDFFNRRPELLPDLAMPTQSGTVVSLADRQAAILRDRNKQMHQRFSELIAVAEENDRTFAGMRALVLALMDAKDRDELSRVLAQHFVAGFGADDVVCYVASEGLQQTDAPAKDAAKLRLVDQEKIDGPLRRAFEATTPVCDAYRPSDYAAIFPAAELDGPGSIAIVPLRGEPSLRGVLAVGAKDPKRFAPEMGSVFLSFAGEALARTLLRIFAVG